MSQDFKECIVLNDRMVHLSLRTNDVPDHGICFVCRKGVSLDTLLDPWRKAVEGVMDVVTAPLRAAS